MRLGVAAATAGLVISMAPATVLAQGFTEALTMTDAIKGSMQITFNTRNEFDTTGKAPLGSPALGAVDTYTVDLDILNSVVFRGTIERRPWIPSAILGRTLQEGYFDYDLRTLLKNPANPAQTVTLGGWIGGLTLDGYGKYNLGHNNDRDDDSCSASNRFREGMSGKGSQASRGSQVPDQAVGVGDVRSQRRGPLRESIRTCLSRR